MIHCQKTVHFLFPEFSHDDTAFLLLTVSYYREAGKLSDIERKGFHFLD